MEDRPAGTSCTTRDEVLDQFRGSITVLAEETSQRQHNGSGAAIGGTGQTRDHPELRTCRHTGVRRCWQERPAM